MKNILIFFIAISIFLSCKKSSNSDEQKDGTLNSCTLSEIAISNGDKITFTHDDKANLKTVSYENENITSTYTYTAATIIQNSSAGSHNDTQTYLLDAQSRIKSQGNRTFKYGAEGYLIEEAYEQTIIKYNWTNGNLTKIERSDEWGIYNTTNIEYSPESRPTDFAGIFAIALRTDVRAEDGMLVRYFGKQSKNLISRITESYSSYRGSYTYSKDNKGNVIKMTRKDENGKEIVYSYKYTCR